MKIGKLCVEVKSTSKISFISEELCIGCGICVKKCPYHAINIINLPKVRFSLPILMCRSPRTR